MSSDNNKRIAKNTLFLYFRMLLTMAVSLYTVRVVLDTLGTVNYGIYNVVGGIVVMFNFLSNTMASASQRFFSFELGRNNLESLKKTFNMCMAIYTILAIIILILAETVGLWFLNTHMNIPIERMDAARWIYQFSVFSFMMTMFTIPYDASIIAHEKMKVYAYISIIEVVLKLIIVYLIVLFPFDKLKLYAILMFSTTTIITFIYRTYCIRKFIECRISFSWDKSIFKELVSYSGWNLFGALSSVFKTQGINIILNMFFGPTVNAARGVAYQVNGAILNFGNNFYTAVRPQIIKSYASNKHDEMMKLVFQSTKFSYYLLLILSIPVLLEPKFILGLWLKEIPNYTSIFIQLVIIDTLIESLANPIVTLVQASGKVKWYQIIVGGVRILNLPIAYFFLYLGYQPESVFYVLIIITILCNIARIIIVKNILVFDLKGYLKNVFFVILLVTLISFMVPKIVQNCWDTILPIKSIIIIIITLISSIVSIISIGTSKNEKYFLYKIITKKIKFNLNQD